MNRSKLHPIALAGAALGAVLVLAAQPAAAAAPAARPAATVATPIPQSSMGDQLAGLILDYIPFEAEVMKGIKQEGNSMVANGGRREWIQMIGDAAVEEFAHDRPVIIGIFGQAFDDHFTLEELRTGLVLFKDPAMQEYIKAGVEGREPAKLTPTRATEKAANSAAGRSFLEKLDKLDTLLEGVQDDIIGELLPGMFRRFADKAEAFEAARKAKRGATAP